MQQKNRRASRSPCDPAEISLRTLTVNLYGKASLSVVKRLANVRAIIRIRKRPRSMRTRAGENEMNRTLRVYWTRDLTSAFANIAAMF